MSESFGEFTEFGDDNNLWFLLDSTPGKWDPDELNQSIIDKDLKRTFPESSGFMTHES